MTNLVLITSMIRPMNDYTIFSAEERFLQTKNTIASVRNKIPHSYVVLIEGSELSIEEFAEFVSTCDFVYESNARIYNKSPGEAVLLHSYFLSKHYSSLQNIQSVSKLSGRYYLDNKFIWDSFPLDRTIIQFVRRSWLNQPMYHTRYYRIPMRYMRKFIKGLERYRSSKEFLTSWPDIEHCFYIYSIIQEDNIYSPIILGVRGLLTGSGQEVID